MWERHCREEASGDRALTGRCQVRMWLEWLEYSIYIYEIVNNYKQWGIEKAVERELIAVLSVLHCASISGEQEKKN